MFVAIFVAKLYLIQESTKYEKTDGNTDFDQDLSKKMELAMAECEKWKAIASTDCSVITLNGLPALTMPFFPPPVA
jgi:hypothetical protein